MKETAAAPSSAPTGTPGKKLVADANLDTYGTTLGLVAQQSPRILQHMLETALQTTDTERARRVAILTAFRGFDWKERLARLATLETECVEFLQPKSQNAKDLQDDTLGQLIFTHPDLVSLNYVPFFLCFLSYFKRFFIPASILMFPLLMIVGPYFLLRYIYKLPLSVGQYAHIMKRLWTGKPDGSLFSTQSIGQMIVSLASSGQPVTESIKQALHLHKTDGIVLSIGSKLGEMITLLREMSDAAAAAAVPFSFRAVLDVPTDPRQLCCLFREQPTRLALLQTTVAELDVFWKLAAAVETGSLTRAQFLEDVSGVRPLLRYRGTDIRDISLSSAVASSIEFVGASTHAALTGPNGGGKSSLLRSVLQTLLLAHAFEHAPGRVELQRVAWISSGIRLHDTPGKQSMFETEVAFATAALRNAASGLPGFILFDELFHSTNPPDGEATSRKFLDALWKMPGACSIVSTHVFSLVETAPATVQRVCFSADLTATGECIYEYRLRPGICRVSSVRNIWRRFGFSGAVAAPAESPAANSLAAREK